MSSNITRYDAVIIGGGFYGVSIAIYLVKVRGLKKVLLVERENSLLSRASYNNQARIHNGYHYPRSFTTAYRSRVNFPKFICDYPQVVNSKFTKIYAIARQNSKVTAKQFERFCKDIDAKIQPINSSLLKLFEPRLIEKVFLVEEYAFDSSKLSIWAKKELSECGIHVSLNSTVNEIYIDSNKKLRSVIKNSNNEHQVVISNYLFNCTYSGINQFVGDFKGIHSAIKHEITEMALIQVPSEIDGLGITIMDGPFFSMMPFPARNLYSLSHVRYTPHFQWKDEQGIDPYTKLNSYERQTRVNRMLRDAGRYLPSILKSKYKDSLFEIKTILEKNESDDGRPILFEKYEQLPGCYSILGGKIDNIYDVIEKLNAENFIYK